MSSPKVLFGFHAVGVRLKTAPQSIIEIFYEPTRRDARMRQFLEKVAEAGIRVVEADGMRLAKIAGSHGHQGVAARVQEIKQVHSLDELLENLEAANADLPVAERTNPLILVLDGVTDPHNLGACLRVADGAANAAAEFQADLGQLGGLARTLEPGEEDHRRRLGAHRELAGRASEGGDELLVHDLDDLLGDGLDQVHVYGWLTHAAPSNIAPCS